MFRVTRKIDMPSRRQIKVAEAIARLAADFFARESNAQSLITVTHAEVTPDLKNVRVYISVLPQTSEEPALAFAKRNRTEFREYLKEHSVLRFLPIVDFEIDTGEKNRQRIDDLTRR